MSGILSISSIAHAENGGVRGGGDPYAAEVFHIARGVAAKLRAWKHSQILSLTEPQILKIECLVDMAPESLCDPKKRLEIFRKEHVYLHPKIPPAISTDETALVNIFAHDPPRIEVGSVRWDQIKIDSEKELMVLHELMGAAGLLTGNHRIDDQFKISYQIQLKEVAEWETFKSLVKMRLIEIRTYSELSLKIDMSHFVTMADCMEALPQYKQLLNRTKYLKSKNLRKIDDFEVERGNEIVDWFNESKNSVTKQFYRANSVYKETGNRKITALFDELQIYPVEWRNWLIDLLGVYTKSITASREEIARDALFERSFNEYYDQFTERKFLEMIPRLQTTIEVLRVHFPKWVNEKALEQTSKNEVLYQNLVDSLAITVSPDQIPKQ